MLRIDRHVRASKVADAVGLGHFIAANVVLIVGLITPLFDAIGTKYPPIAFLYHYLERPLVWFDAMGAIVASSMHGSLTYALIVCEMVIILCSLIYGMVSYFVARVCLIPFASD